MKNYERKNRSLIKPFNLEKRSRLAVGNRIAGWTVHRSQGFWPAKRGHTEIYRGSENTRWTSSPQINSKSSSEDTGVGFSVGAIIKAAKTGKILGGRQVFCLHNRKQAPPVRIRMDRKEKETSIVTPGPNQKIEKTITSTDKTIMKPRKLLCLNCSSFNVVSQRYAKGRFHHNPGWKTKYHGTSMRTNMARRRPTTLKNRPRGITTGAPAVCAGMPAPITSCHAPTEPLMV